MTSAVVALSEYGAEIHSSVFQSTRKELWHMKRLTKACNYRGTGEDEQKYQHVMRLRATRELLLHKNNPVIIIDGEEYRELTVSYERIDCGRFDMKVKVSANKFVQSVRLDAETGDDGSSAPLCAATCARKIRGHIFSPLYDTLDIAACHPVHFLHLFRQFDLPVSAIAPLIENIKEARVNIQRDLSVSEAAAKDVLNQLPNGKSFQSWCLENGVVMDEKVQFLSDYQRQVQANRDVVLCTPPYDAVLLKAAARNQKLGDPTKCAKRTAFSWINCDAERRMVTAASIFMEKQREFEVDAFIHDCMMVRKDRNMNQAAVEMCSAFVHACTGCMVDLVHKPLEDFEELLSIALPDDRLLPIEHLFPERRVSAMPSIPDYELFGSWVTAGKAAASEVIDKYKKVTGGLEGFAYDGDKVYKIDEVSGRYIRYKNDMWVHDIATRVSSVISPLFMAFVHAAWDVPTETYASTPSKKSRWHERLLSIASALKDTLGFMAKVAKEFCKQVYDKKMRTPAGLDSNTHLIGFENGVLDLDQRDASGRFLFRRARHDEYVSMSTGYDYEAIPKTDPRYKRVETIIKDLFIRRHTGNASSGQYGDFMTAREDPNGYDTYEKAMMLYCSPLKDGNNIQSLIFFVGVGANGKSVLANMSLAALGDYACVLPGSFWEVVKKSAREGDPMMMSVRGTRYAFTMEIRSSATLDAQVVKSFTGGDRQVARYLFENDYHSFYVDALPIWCVNNLPESWSETGSAVTRRALAVPFDFKFCATRPDEVDARNAKLQDSELETRKFKHDVCMPMMQLMLDFYGKYAEQNEPKPSSKAMRDVTGDVKDSIDEVAVFIRETVALAEGDGFFVPQAFLKKLFKEEKRGDDDDDDIRGNDKAFDKYDKAAKAEILEVLGDSRAKPKVARVGYRQGVSGTTKVWQRLILKNPAHAVRLCSDLQIGKQRDEMIKAYQAREDTVLTEDGQTKKKYADVGHGLPLMSDRSAGSARSKGSAGSKVTKGESSKGPQGPGLLEDSEDYY